MKKSQPKKLQSSAYSLEGLKKDILEEARVLRIHSGFANQIAEKVVQAVEKFLSSHPIVTKEEVETIVVSELKKYNKDLAYIYHNRDKII